MTKLWFDLLQIEHTTEGEQLIICKRMAKDIKFNRTGVYALVAIGMLVMIFLLYRTTRSTKTESIKISELLSASIVLAERGGKRIVEIREMDDQEIGQLSKGLTKEGKNEYVTLGDKVKLGLFIYIYIYHVCTVTYYFAKVLRCDS